MLNRKKIGYETFSFKVPNNKKTSFQQDENFCDNET